MDIILFDSEDVVVDPDPADSYDVDGLPSEWHAESVDAYPTEPLANLRADIAAQLTNPLAALPLTDLCGVTTKVTVVCDAAPHRNTLSALLGGVLKELESAGVPPEQVTVLIPSQMDKFGAGDVALLGLVGSYASRIHPIRHDPDDVRELDDLGSFEGVQLAVNYRAVEADLLIAISVAKIEDYTRKGGSNAAVAVGMSGLATMREVRTTRFYDDRVDAPAYARPLFERVVREGARRAGLVFAVDALEDANGCVVAVRAGAPNAVNDALTELAMTMRDAPVASPTYDVVLAEPGPRNPFGLFDASRAAISIGLMVNPVLMRGGALILPIGRSDGDTATSRAFFEALTNAAEPEMVIQQLQGRSLDMGEARAYLLAHVMQRHHLIAAGRQEQLARDSHFVPASSVREAAELAESFAGRRPRALIVRNPLRTSPTFSGRLDNADPEDDLLIETPRFG
jgi:hypothetical protein